MITLFRNIRVIDSFSNLDDYKDILVENDIIKDIAEPNSVNNPDFHIVEYSKKSLLIPGIIDLRVETKDPGETHTDNLETLLK